MTEKPERLLNPDDLAELLGTSRISIIRQSRAGKIPAIKIGEAWRSRSGTINWWLAENEKGSGV